MRLENERTPIGIDQDVAFATIDLLARVIATWTASLRRLDGLAVDDGRCRARFPPGELAVNHNQRVIDLLETTRVTPGHNPSIHGPARRKISGEKPPWTARTHNVEDCVDDLAQGPAPGPSFLLRSGNKRFYHAPFFISDVALVTQSETAILLPSV